MQEEQGQKQCWAEEAEATCSLIDDGKTLHGEQARHDVAVEGAILADIDIEHMSTGQGWRTSAEEGRYMESSLLAELPTGWAARHKYRSEDARLLIADIPAQDAGIMRT